MKGSRKMTTTLMGVIVSSGSAQFDRRMGSGLFFNAEADIGCKQTVDNLLKQKTALK